VRRFAWLVVGSVAVALLHLRAAQTGMARLLYAETDALWLVIVAKMYHSTGGVLGVLRVLRACCGPKFVLLI